MVAEMASRRLAWDGCLNARDLGGLPTIDGRLTRWRSIVRSECPTRLSASGRAALVDYGVRVIVDLRLPTEISDEPNPFAEPLGHGVAYVHRSFIDPAADSPPEFTTLANDYKGMLRRFRRQVAAIMAAIAATPRECVLVHCAAGKDRTGLVAALLLELANVRREVVVKDYALTSEYLRPRDEQWLASGPGERAERERQLALFRAREEVMDEVLGHVDEEYGGASRYLRWASVSDDALAILRARLVDVGGSERGGEADRSEGMDSAAR